MDQFSEHLRASLSPAGAKELQLFLAGMMEEAQEKETILKATLEKLLQHVTEMEHARKAQVEEWQREKERVEAAGEAAKRDLHEKHRNTYSRLQSNVDRRAEELEMERKKLVALEKEHKRVVFLLEMKEEEDYDKMMAKETERMIAESSRWDRWTKERESCTLSTALTAAVLKQRLLQELKSQAEKWMVTQGANGTERAPMVFKSWMLRDQWRKLQDNRACLNDDLQSFINRQKIEDVIVENQTLKGEIDVEFEKKMERHMIETLKKQEKLKASVLKKKVKVEEKTRKALEKVQKAELKEKQRKEAKERKEAEKLEKRAREERAKTSQPSAFCCWRKSSTVEEDA
ncbi:vicilin-like seed storage protein At2g18540 [Alosa sapidissima]|uniref:vicilin-like seed storage protein At2g18540 n=1 Tax=Alosa sapidissima TaxID=34773 RepID=UPI001C07FD2B|nr:vicilin-like seed storage protein At2g18540 [Alosa sapidissima]